MHLWKWSHTFLLTRAKEDLCLSNLRVICMIIFICQMKQSFTDVIPCKTLQLKFHGSIPYYLGYKYLRFRLLLKNLLHFSVSLKNKITIGELFHVLWDVALYSSSNAVSVVRLVLGKRFQLLRIAVGSNLTNLEGKPILSNSISTPA